MAQRSARGELRASREEVAAFERYLDARGDDADVSADTRAMCDCGHPLAHHDANGSCFHVVGCATGCACGRNR